jgi:large subunit ribosomal protein L25
MAEIVLLPTEMREGRGTRISEKLRKLGKVPAVVYGHKEKTLSISVGHDVLLSAVRHGARIVDVQLDGKVEKAQIMELQWDYLGKDVLHVDFKRVSADERIQITVPVELKGIAPGIAAGGLLDQPLHTLRIECPVLAVPDSIKVNINELQLDTAVHVRDLKLPEGVKVLDEADAIVVQLKTPMVDAEAGEAAEGTAEPEIITARKKAEDEAEEKK